MAKIDCDNPQGAIKGMGVKKFTGPDGGSFELHSVADVIAWDKYCCEKEAAKKRKGIRTLGIRMHKQRRSSGCCGSSQCQ